MMVLFRFYNKTVFEVSVCYIIYSMLVSLKSIPNTQLFGRSGVATLPSSSRGTVRDQIVYKTTATKPAPIKVANEARTEGEPHYAEDECIHIKTLTPKKRLQQQQLTLPR